MSPEQWRREEVDARTDVYSLGVVAYELLAGEPPFLGKTRSIALEHTEDPPPPLWWRAPHVPRRIAIVIEAALAKKREDRPPSVAAFAASLHAGTESTAGLLRRSLTILADHFPLLMRWCLVLNSPVLGLWLLHEAVHLEVAKRLLPRVVVVAVDLVQLMALWLLMPAVEGVLVPLVANLATLRAPPPSRPKATEVARVVMGSAPSMMVCTVAAFLSVAVVGAGIAAAFMAGYAEGQSISGGRGGLLTPFALLGLFLGLGGLVALTTITGLIPAVVAVEHSSGLTPLRRAGALFGRIWRPALGVQLLTGLFSLGPLVPMFARLVASGGTQVTESDMVLHWWSYAILFAAYPLHLVPFALLYIRAREAEGRPLVVDP
jgi:Protein tyrosine and serine/threonine kinase